MVHRLIKSVWGRLFPVKKAAPMSKIELVESKLLRLPQVEVPLEHRFAPGIYLREVTMPAGTLVIGHEHKTEHFNIVLSGRARVMIGGKVQEVVAPCILKSEVGVRKILLIQEEMRWVTVHPTEETDIERLEDLLITRSGAWLENEKNLRGLLVDEDINV